MTNEQRNVKIVLSLLLQTQEGITLEELCEKTGVGKQEIERITHTWRSHDQVIVTENKYYIPSSKYKLMKTLYQNYSAMLEG